MKQAQTDADELIAAYRLEQQEAFDKAASADGKRNASEKSPSRILSLCISRPPLTIILCIFLYVLSFINRWIRQ